MDKERNIIRHIKKCLYNYRFNLIKYNLLNEILITLREQTDVHAYNCDILPSSGSTSSPVDRYMERITHIERRLTQVKTLITPINHLLAYVLKHDWRLFEIFQHLYYERHKKKEIAHMLGVSTRTIAKRDKQLIKKAMEYLKV